MPPAVERRPSMTSAAELRDQMLNRRTSSATEAQAMRERNVDADMLNRQEMRGGGSDGGGVGDVDGGGSAGGGPDRRRRTRHRPRGSRETGRSLRRCCHTWTAQSARKSVRRRRGAGRESGCS